MSPTRRDLLKLAAAAPAFALPALTPLRARAQLGAPAAGNPAHFSFMIGDTKLTVVSDGYFTLPVTMFGINASPEEVQAFMAAHFLSPTDNYAHTNHLLIERGTDKVLVDVGSGHRFFDTAGRLAANLDTLGLGLEDITHVVITHAHPDHIWGLRDEFDEPLFPEAQYFVGEAERGYWLQDGLVDRVAPADQQFVVGAVNSLTAEGVDWQLMQEGFEVVPGVTVIDTPGHTPGHMSVLVTDGDNSLIALGDAMNHAWMNFAHPGWYNASDTDGELAVSTRRRLLDMAAADRIPVLGYHFPFPGVGHVMAEGEAYRFVPALWQF
ncbi:MBL fold metallo-hydrolase [Pseudooceanicola onchidii]|uniref:MBL fold metallo-hydrolase n=1 Tax=Pseudooceanicola onchidii TaxID=2562279 RepID=UPI0010AA8C6E|nr:MBL fold metallo-hydrolase [Pseudooceanicola onchidii]